MTTIEATLAAEQLPMVAQEAHQSVTATLLAICGSPAEALEGDGGPAMRGEGVVGVISLFGTVSWTIMLGLPRAAATELAGRFAGFDVDYESADMGDLVGELTNVLAGDLVARLDEAGIEVEMSLPTIVRGSDLGLVVPGGAPSQRLRFRWDQHSFWLVVAGDSAARASCRRAGS